MPVNTGLTGPLLTKYFHQGKSDKWIAEQFHITPSAVGQRRRKLGLYPNPIINRVNKGLSRRWDIWSTKEGTAHHNLHSAKALKLWLRLQLGDKSLSEQQIHMAQMWVSELVRRDEVLCYDPTTEEGWFYRPRTREDRGLIIDWPRELPFPDQEFKRALELPTSPPGDPS